MPGTGRPIREETKDALWVGILGMPLFLPGLVVATFAGQPAPGQEGRAWAVRGGLALFAWWTGWAVAVPRLRELERRGEWLPPGVRRRPRLATAGYVATVLLAAGVAWAAAIFGLAWALRASGLVTE